jgi:hypothetical protein
MAERKKHGSEKGAVELSEKDLEQAQGGADAFQSSDTTEAQAGRLKWNDITLKKGYISSVD